MRKWKIVFGIAAFFFAMQLIRLPFRSHLDITDFLLLILSGFSLFPLYGYSYQITVGSKPIAVAIFSINTFIAVASLVIVGSLVILGGLGAMYVLPFLVAGLIQGVFLYPQFLYAFKSDELWAKNA
ncbi:MAG TPA: hypothetical protein VGK97_07290 [Spongiibacteraceae bacterium]|jgi:hypothetical protein